MRLLDQVREVIRKKHYSNSHGTGLRSMALPVQVASYLGCWSIAKYQIPSTKLQTNLKFQYSMTETGLKF
jgi:hypothetical protein